MLARICLIRFRGSDLVARGTRLRRLRLRRRRIRLRWCVRLRGWLLLGRFLRSRLGVVHDDLLRGRWRRRRQRLYLPSQMSKFVLLGGRQLLHSFSHGSARAFESVHIIAKTLKLVSRSECSRRFHDGSENVIERIKIAIKLKAGGEILGRAANLRHNLRQGRLEIALNGIDISLRLALSGPVSLPLFDSHPCQITLYRRRSRFQLVKNAVKLTHRCVGDRRRCRGGRWGLLCKRKRCGSGDRKRLGGCERKEANSTERVSHEQGKGQNPGTIEPTRYASETVRQVRHGLQVESPISSYPS